MADNESNLMTNGVGETKQQNSNLPSHIDGDRGQDKSYQFSNEMISFDQNINTVNNNNNNNLSSNKTRSSVSNKDSKHRSSNNGSDIKIARQQVYNTKNHPLETSECAFINGVYVLKDKPVHEWSVQDVSLWLKSNNFGSYVDLFCNQHQIDGRVLINLTADDLRSEPLKLRIFGDIKRFCLAFDVLRSIYPDSNCSRPIQDRRDAKFKQQLCSQLSNSSSRNMPITKSGSISNNNNNRISQTGNAGALTVSFDSDKSSSESRSSGNKRNDSTEAKHLSVEDDDQDFERIRVDFDMGNDQYNIINSQEELPPDMAGSQSSSPSSSWTSSSLSESSDSDSQSEITENQTTNYRHDNSRIATRVIPTVTTGAELAKLISVTHSGHHNYQHQTSMLIQPPSSSLQTKKYASQINSRYYRHNHHHHNQNHHHHKHHHHHRKEIKPEAWKAIVALIYFFLSTWVTAIVMVIVHDRVPDMDTYPPLPDLLLDNLPLIPWAFSMAETCGLILFIIWILILIFHKYRFILLRRMFSLFGSVFLIRCFTMVITSLSVPGRHLQCKARPYGTWSERLHQAYVIWQGGGMAIQGVRTCGDYMFSGHTVVLTMLNFFITEYTPPGLYLIHTMSWVLNLFGVFFILAAHEHYSIDVFIAFYISTRLFLYYHTLANNRALYQRDRHRTRIWFPLFSFFESGVSGIVPNEYEIPFRRLMDRLINYLVTRIGHSKWVRMIFDNEWSFEEDSLSSSPTPPLPVNNSYSKLKSQ